MSGTLVGVFIGVALLCVIAGVVAVSRTRQDSREDGQDPEMTYAEEQAAVAAAQAAEPSAPDDQDEDDEEPLS